MEFKVTDHSKEVLEALKNKTYKAVETCGLVAEGYAKTNLTKEMASKHRPESWYTSTGALRNSISHKVVQEGEKTLCYIGSNMEYAPYVEFGTGVEYDGGGRRTTWVYKGSDGKFHMTNGQRAKPFLKPAITEHKDKYKQIIQQELKG